ncbi:DUF192 domain-containing protein [Bacillus sp. AFS015802]|uniref:DUF192 domain-containing protein n=1 Tax=Bacillus sp. AFS015802 TaxID=2033486 RepID=UPI0015CF18E0|nr:DUF192 domain-containing protein [Bacillus sp. AFS015802]
MEETTLYRTIPYPLKKADRFLLRLRGLMFRKKPLQEEGIWITPCNSIHMFFMRFSIDAVFLDREQRVIKLIPDLHPWKMTLPVRHAHSVIELPSGSIRRLGIKEAQIIGCTEKEPGV